MTLSAGVFKPFSVHLVFGCDGHERTRDRQTALYSRLVHYVDVINPNPEAVHEKKAPQ